MNVCIVTDNVSLARFIELELAEIGYSSVISDSPSNSALNVCDLDFVSEAPENSIGFSCYDEKRTLVKDFLQRPISAEKLKNAVTKRLALPSPKSDSAIEVNIFTRKAKTDKGEVKLSEKEFAILKELCKVSLLTREDGIKIFGDGDSNVVDVYIHYLRKKLAKVFDGEAVRSVRGEGYSLSNSVTIKFTTT